MFIQTEETPNPASVKFLPGRVVLSEGTASFANENEAAGSRLARNLLAVPGVSAVFFGYDFITITKSEDADWPLIKPHVLTVIMDHFVSGLSVMETEQEAHPAYLDETDPLIRQIRELIETKVRPAVAMDGGDILFDRFEEGVVFLKMQGACSGCPSSTATLKNGIENMLRHYVPEVLEVRAA